jgi:hypothetical protein
VRPWRFFAPSAPWAPLVRGGDRLRLGDRGGGVPVTPRAGTDRVAELIVTPEPGATVAPGAPGLIRRLPTRQSRRH